MANQQITVNVNSAVDGFLRWVKFAGVILAMVVGFAKGYYMLKSEIDITNQNAYKINRVEHYLSSHDPEYWRTPVDANMATTRVHTFGGTLGNNAAADTTATPKP